MGVAAEAWQLGLWAGRAAVGVATEAGVVTKVVAAAWTLTNLLKKRYSSLTAGLENEKKIRLVVFRYVNNYRVFFIIV